MTAGDVEVVRGSLNSRKAMALDGTDDYMLADAHVVARVAAGDTVGTYSARIFVDAVATTQTFLSAGDNDNANEYFRFNITAGGILETTLRHGGATQFDIKTAAGVIKAKTWYHVAVVQDGVQPILYVNGIAVDATNATSTDLTAWYGVLTLCDKFALGVKESNGTHSEDFNGMISDTKYWSLNLNAKQVLDDYKGNTAEPAVTAVLQSHWDFDEDYADAGLGADTGTPTGHAYLCGWGSEWSRQIELNALVADHFENLGYDSAGNQTTLILKAA